MAAVFEVPKEKMEGELKHAHAISVGDRSYRIHRNGFVFAEERHVPNLVAHGLVHLENGVDFPVGYEPVAPDDKEGHERLQADSTKPVESEGSWRERFGANAPTAEDLPGPSAGAGRRMPSKK